MLHFYLHQYSKSTEIETVLTTSGIILNATSFQWKKKHKSIYSLGGARGVMDIVVGNEHGYTSSNPGRD